jgi:nucleoside-diphosphate-sugar epimerase
MALTLVTGASGYIGRRLIQKLSRDRDVLIATRRPSQVPGPSVIIDLRDKLSIARLDQFDIDVVVHLAGAGPSSTDGQCNQINEIATRNLFEYMALRGRVKALVASSIAVVGTRNPVCRPLSFPISDDHLCCAQDAYGISKGAMEESVRKIAQSSDSLKVICVRLASVVPSSTNTKESADTIPGLYSVSKLSWIREHEAIEILTGLMDCNIAERFIRVNAASPVVRCLERTSTILRRWYGPDYSTEWYDAPCHLTSGLFDVRKLQALIGLSNRVPC